MTIADKTFTAPWDIFPQAAAGQELGHAANRWDLYARTIDLSGNIVMVDDTWIGVTGDIRIEFDLSDGDIMLHLGDAAGADEVQFVDSGAAVVAYIDSNGNADFAAHLAVGGLAAITAATVAFISEQTTSVAGNEYGLWARLDANPGGASTLRTHGFRADARQVSAQAMTNTNALRGFFGGTELAGIGNVWEAIGLEGRTNITIDGASARTQKCFQAAGYYGVVNGTAAITNQYMIYIKALTGAAGHDWGITNLYGLYIEAMTIGATNWAIYSAGGDSYHESNFTFNNGILMTGGANAVLTLNDNAANAHTVVDAGATEYLRYITTDAQPVVVWNEGGADVDFRWEAVGVDPALFVQGSDGFVGIGIAVPVAHIDIYDATVDTTATYIGFRSNHIKTAGATDHADSMLGMQGIMEIDQAAGVVGNTYGCSFVSRLTAGTIGTAPGNTRNLYGFRAQADLDAGTLTGNVYGVYGYIDQEAANTVAGDAYVVYAIGDFDGTVTGTSHMVYLDEQSNVDYGIYQNGSADNYLGGNVGIAMLPTANGLLCIGGPTENLEFIDAGSAGATEQDWIEVEVGGVQGFIRVFAAV